MGLFVRSTFPKATVRQAFQPSTWLMFLSAGPPYPPFCEHGCLLGFSPAVCKSGLSHYTPLVCTLILDLLPSPTSLSCSYGLWIPVFPRCLMFASVLLECFTLIPLSLPRFLRGFIFCLMPAQTTDPDNELLGASHKIISQKFISFL